MERSGKKGVDSAIETARKLIVSSRGAAIVLAALLIVAGSMFLLSLIIDSAGTPAETELSQAGLDEIDEQIPALSRPDVPVLVPPPPDIDPNAIDDLLSRDSIQAIDDPRFGPASQAYRFMAADEQVIGVTINGDSRAYPIPVLSVHEIVNDMVGGEPIAVTWCPLCYTALVFSRNIQNSDIPVSFGVSGKLLYETLVMYDRESDSLWSQLYGSAVEGPLAGERLSYFPSVFTDWESWVEQHSESLVLDKEATCERFDCGTYSSNPRGSYHVDPYESYYIESGEGVVNAQIPRDLGEPMGAPKKRVLGIRIAGRAKAYPYSGFSNGSLVNDEVNGVPILLWLEPETRTGLAYLRTVPGAGEGDQTLSFVEDAEKEGRIFDQETGSLWDVFSGTAVNGPMEGARLSPVFATSAFAFGWYDYFPESETFAR